MKQSLVDSNSRATSVFQQSVTRQFGNVYTFFHALFPRLLSSYGEVTLPPSDESETPTTMSFYLEQSMIKYHLFLCRKWKFIYLKTVLPVER